MAKNLEFEKLYYTITEVAKMFDVSTSLIRFWESEFTILNPAKTSRGNRRYTKKDIERLNVVYHLVKEKGFTLEGAKKELKENKSYHLNKNKQIEKLKEIRGFLVKMKSELSKE